jgi:lipoprotein-releasing system permease protein
MPGVLAAPTLRASVLMRYGGRDVAASLLGIEPERERRVSNIERDLTIGTLRGLYTTANGVILGNGLADKLGAEVGDTFTVSAPDGGAMKMTVVGIFHSGVVAFDSSEAYALLKKVQVLANRPNVVNEIRMHVDDVRGASDTSRRIEARFGYRTESWEEANEGVIEVFEIRNVIMYTVVAAIMVVAAFGIFNIVSTITHEKARDIAILKSLGFPARDIRGIFVIEGFVLGAFGSVMGWVFGYALFRALGAIKFEVSFVTDLTHLPLHFSLLHYAIAAGFAVAAATLAGYLPARKAARVNPVDIVRGAA